MVNGKGGNEKGGVDMSQRRIKVRGIQRDEIDIDKLALAYWLMAKRAVEEKRQREAEEKAGRREGRS
jgi:hypothetical protein